MNKKQETIGVYTFVTKNWEELDLPLDLWVEWHLKFFDQIAICTYGNGKFLDKYRKNKKIIIKQINIKIPKTLDFFTIPETIAMHALTTDWKVILDVDQFLNEKIDISRLDKNYAYPIICHDLYGNLYTEHIGKFSLFHTLMYGKKDIQYRIHYKNRKLLGDGAWVEIPHIIKKSLFKNLLYLLLTHMPKQFIKRLYSNEYIRPSIQNLLENYKLMNGEYCEFEVWHTSSVRKPKKLIKNLVIKSSKYNATKNFEQKNDIDKFKLFNYKDKKNYYKLIHAKDVPSILIKNKARFNHVHFNKLDYKI